MRARGRTAGRRSRGQYVSRYSSFWSLLNLLRGAAGEEPKSPHPRPLSVSSSEISGPCCRSMCSQGGQTDHEQRQYWDRNRLGMNPQRNKRISGQAVPRNGSSSEEPYSTLGPSSGSYSSVRPIRLTGDSINKDRRQIWRLEASQEGGWYFQLSVVLSS